MVFSGLPVLLAALAAAPYPSGNYQYDPPLPPEGISRSEFERWLRDRPQPQLRAPDARLGRALQDRFAWPRGTKATVAVVGPPRVTGVAYPKFYVWVRAADERGEIITDGAARCALIEDERESLVEVRDFVPKTVMLTPGFLESVFPWDAMVLIKKFL